MLDYFNLTLATFYNLYLVGGPMHLPLGYTVPLAAGIKEVATLPVFATGRINDPALAERVLADGQADMIGVVRGPDRRPRLRRARPGRGARRRSATASPATRTATGAWASTRPSAACRTRRWARRPPRASITCKPALRKKRVMVVGGGPAGMWAAKIATLRGHDVTLYDKGEELGGQVLIAAKGAGRDEFGVIVRNERNQLDQLGVPVKLASR